MLAFFSSRFRRGIQHHVGCVSPVPGNREVQAALGEKQGGSPASDPKDRAEPGGRHHPRARPEHHALHASRPAVELGTGVSAARATARIHIRAAGAHREAVLTPTPSVSQGLAHLHRQEEQGARVMRTSGSSPPAGTGCRPTRIPGTWGPGRFGEQLAGLSVWKEAAGERAEDAPRPRARPHICGTSVRRGGRAPKHKSRLIGSVKCFPCTFKIIRKFFELLRPFFPKKGGRGRSQPL